MTTPNKLHFLEDRWDEAVASQLDGPELLRYRSNLLGSDLRLTNFGGGNTSSKLELVDPLDGETKTVLWVKGSGGDLGSIKRAGFATLYLDKVLSLARSYKGVEREDEIVSMYPLCTFDNNPVAASIDTPLHGFLPFPHVDHLHPDWGIALAASANGHEKMEQFNERFGHKMVWVPWQRPGFELAMMLRDAVEAVPGCDGVVLGGHGLFTWGQTQRESYLNTITIIDQIGQFIAEHKEKKGASFGGAKVSSHAERQTLALKLMPMIRGRVSAKQRTIGSFTDAPDVLAFVNSHSAKQLAHLGTSCPDHFIRTKIRPLFVEWDPASDVAELEGSFDSALAVYREEYAAYYQAHALKESPAMRDSSPTVVLVPGIGMFSFGKNKAESRITGEFYLNAIHVMEGAGGMDELKCPPVLPQAGNAAPTTAFTVHENYVALPPSEAFRIEYWALEEAKIRRQPPEKELSRRVVLVVGGASGIGRETVLLAAERGAHIVVADLSLEAAQKVADEAKTIGGKECAVATTIDIRKRDAIKVALDATIAAFGGIDLLINTAAMFPSSPDGVISDAQWALTLEVNVTANYLLTDEASAIFKKQGLPGSVVLTSSANAVVPKRGTEAYDVSKAALSHLVRELAVTYAPLLRVNGISPATVVKGSTMFPRDRVKASLTKYAIAFEEAATDDDLRNLLAGFYAKRTLTHVPIDPKDCAEAILFIGGPKAPVTTGHLVPVWRSDRGISAMKSGVSEIPEDRRALVAIDLGAESCRVSLLRWTTGAAAITLVHRFANHAVERDGELRWPLTGILEDLQQGLRMCAKIAVEEIRSIAVDGWAVDYVRLSTAGEAVAEPFCYRDERTVAAETLLHERISPERMRELTGLQLLRINTVYQHLADGPELRALRWLNLPEYVLYTLGARPVAELTNATHSQLVGLDGQWSGEVFAALEQPLTQAPEMVAPGTDVGALRGELAKLPAFANTRLIAPACHDTASAIAAISDVRDDWAYISSGTWSLVGTVLNAPINTLQARAENFTNLGGADGTVCFHKNVNGMWLLRQCMESWNTEQTVAELVEAAAAFGPRGYVLDVDDPELLLQDHMPERINAQLRRRGLAELSGDVSHAAEMASFLFYSLAARYAEVLKSVAAISGKQLRRLYIMGGGSQNELLNRLTAQATGLEVRRAGTECSTLGNFAVQLATLEGPHEPGARAACGWAALLGQTA